MGLARDGFAMVVKGLGQLGMGLGMGMGMGTVSSSRCGTEGGRPYDLISNSLAISTICMPVINTL